MKKWGIQLIGIFFLFWAILELIELLTETNSSQGFLEITVTTSYPVDLMAWIGVFVLAYTGYHLLRLNSQGHTLALVILGLYALYSGVYFILIVILSTASLTSSTPLFITLDFLNKSFKIDNPTALITIGALFLFYVIQ